MGQTHSQQQDIITEYEDKIYSRNLEIKNLKNKKHNEILELTQSLKNTNDMLQNVKTQHEILYDKFTQESIIASDNAHQVQLYKDFWNVLEDEFKCSEFVGEYIKSNNVEYIEDSHELNMLKRFIQYIVDRKNSKIITV